MIIPNYPEILSVEELTSTNDYLKQLSVKNELKQGTVVVAEYQNQGKGQRGKKWESEKGKNLLFSMYLDSTRKGNPFVLNMLVSLAICELLHKNGIKESVSIKWPNDVLVGRDKIAGILIENTIGADQRTKTYIGVGLNVNQKVFENTDRKAVSIINILGTPVDVIELAEDLREIIWDKFQKGKWQQIITKYNEKLYGKGEPRLFASYNEELEIRSFTVDVEGFLGVTLLDGKIRQFIHGELTYLI